MQNKSGKMKKFLLGFWGLLLGGNTVATAGPQKLNNLPTKTPSNESCDANSQGIHHYSPDGISLELSLIKNGMPERVRNQVLALSLLAENIFACPVVAEEFSQNPAEYLSKIGMENVRINKESQEVKIILALGDPKIREAVKRGDIDTFLKQLDARGLLKRPETSMFATQFEESVRLDVAVDAISLVAAQAKATVSVSGVSVSKQGTALQSIQKREEIAAVITVAYAIAAVVSQAAVGYNVVAAINAAVETNLVVHSNVRVMGVESSSDMILGAPGFQVARLLGGDPFTRQAADKFLEVNSERIASAIENMESYRAKTPLDADVLRNMIRKQISMHMRND